MKGDTRVKFADDGNVGLRSPYGKLLAGRSTSKVFVVSPFWQVGLGFRPWTPSPCN